MLSWAGIFQFGTFLGVALSDSGCIFAIGHFSNLSNSFPILLIYSVLSVMFPSFPYFACHPVVSMPSCILHRNFWKNFFSFFWNVLFWLCFILSRYLFSLPFFDSTFWFISSTFIFCLNRCVAFLVSSKPISAFALCLIIFIVVIDFLPLFPVEFPIQVLNFCPCSLREHRIFHRLISLPHCLVNLIPWCCSLRYVLIICLFFQSLLWLFSSLGFLAIVI